MKNYLPVILLLLFAVPVLAQKKQQYPFQNPSLDVEKRIDNLLSLMTLEEKVAVLSTNPSVPRLGVVGTGHVEGLHGLALGGPGKMGRKRQRTNYHHHFSTGLWFGRNLGCRFDSESGSGGRL